MELFVKRMQTEYHDLEGKLRKARAALENRPFSMSEEEAALLSQQVDAMSAYLSCLEKRLRLHGGIEWDI